MPAAAIAAAAPRRMIVLASRASAGVGVEMAVKVPPSRGGRTACSLRQPRLGVTGPASLFDRDVVSHDGGTWLGHTSRMQAVAALVAPGRPARSAGWAANVLGAITIVVALAGAGLALRTNGGLQWASADWLVSLVGTFAYAVPGAQLAARRPRNSVGWLCLLIGAAYATSHLAAAYGTYGLRTAPGGLPGAVWMRWLGLWVWSVAYGLIPSVLLLVVPTGRLVSSRWRPVMWAAATGVACLAGAWALTPYHARDAAVSMPHVTNPVGVSWGPSLFVVAGALLVVGVAGGLASLVVRYRRTRGSEREQVSWVLLGAAGTVFLLTIAWTLPYDGLGQHLGTLALVPLPACLAVAVLRHGLWDVTAA